MENSNGIVSREKLDQVAVWLSATVSSAFFTSLERFSCVNVSTDDDDDDDDDDDCCDGGGGGGGGVAGQEKNSQNEQPRRENDVAKLPV